jgi:hypothetical protein
VAPAPREILFVRRSPASDHAVAARLAAAGWRITERTDSAVTADDARGKALVLVSEQVSAQAIGTRLREVAVPLMVWECGLYPGLGLAANAGTSAPASAVTIVQPGHPLAAGLSGAVTVTRGAQPLSTVKTQGVAPGALIATAVASGRGPLAAIIAYEHGEPLMDGGRAPARRVGFFLAGTVEDALTPAGWALFDAAIAWCADPGPPARPPP